VKPAILDLLAPLWLGVQPTFNKGVVPILQAGCQIALRDHRFLKSSSTPPMSVRPGIATPAIS
jgi:hypothetical protein